LLDSFFALRSGVDMGKGSASTTSTSQSTAMVLKNGIFSIEIDTQVFKD